MKVYLASCDETSRLANLLPSNEGRQILVDSLIEAFGLHEFCEVFDVEPADEFELQKFHSNEFVEELLREREIGGAATAQLDTSYGLSYDCPIFPELKTYVERIAGSSICAAEKLLECKRNPQSERTAVINWYGGRHHCLKEKAAGFCYVNDVVLAILKLRTRYRRIFYLDLDLHHGDGVENAFRFSKNVTTCSIHRFDVGFFPGSGALSDTGTYNFPTKRGLSDATFRQIVENKIIPLLEQEQPEVLVIQCGADGLASDPHGEWNLTIKGYTDALLTAVNSVTSAHIMLLGGGGYNHRDTARLWCYITGQMANVSEEWTTIPSHPNLEQFHEDRFQFWTDGVCRAKPGRRDENSLDVH